MSKNKQSMIPSGFTPLGLSKVDGWYVPEEGNFVQGILEGSFHVETKLGTKKVFRVKLTKGGTKAMIADADNASGTLGVGDVCGVDQRGFLKPLDDVEEGKEIFLVCTGRGTAKKGQSAPYTFDLAVKA